MDEEKQFSIPMELDQRWKEGLGRRLDKQDQVLDRLLQRQDTQDEKLERLEENSKYANNFFNSAKGAMAFFDFMNKLIKPFIALGMFVITAWAAWKAKS